MYKKTLLIILVALATGCASEEPNIRVVRNSGIKTAEVKLAEAAVSVSRSLQELAKIEQASHPQAKLPAPLNAEMLGMAQTASIDWNGPVGPLVQKIATATHYKVHVLGIPPAIPILVAVSAKDTPLADILRDVGFQCGTKANIVIYPSSKIIELRYAKP